jgi:hypothetical protein
MMANDRMYIRNKSVSGEAPCNGIAAAEWRMHARNDALLYNSCPLPVWSKTAIELQLNCRTKHQVHWKIQNSRHQVTEPRLYHVRLAAVAARCCCCCCCCCSTGTITHLAPERFETGSKLTAGVDIYAFGEACCSAGLRA